MTKPCHLGHLSDIHTDLLISSLNTVYLLYPYLSQKPVKVFIEANLSHDLPVSVQTKVSAYYNSHHSNLVPINFVKQHDSFGRLLPGILTRHKANLVSYFKSALDRDLIFIARQFVTVSRRLEMKYGDNECEMTKSLDMGVGMVIPDISDMEYMLKLFIEQATMFRCYQKGKGIVYSGKRGTGSNTKVDDLVMAVILAVAWARLPQNTYVLQ